MCYELKINSFTPIWRDVPYTTHVYLCIDLVPARLDSCGYVEHWKAWLEAIMFIWMTGLPT